ncbi:MAG: flagellar export protein FliJ [Bdellovibrionaceae bacterium]|nr:flagellar export protein FliJ [Pseudobdellovibrionaceae bacterium]
MKKFKFTLEKVLVQRNIIKDTAERSFAEAQQLLNAENDALNALTEAREQSVTKRRILIDTTQDWMTAVDQINQFINGQDLRIKKQHLRIKDAENLVESRREILRQAVSEVKIIERLEEKQKKAYLAEVAKADQAELDELTVLRFSRNENRVK